MTCKLIPEKTPYLMSETKKTIRSPEKVSRFLAVLQLSVYEIQTQAKRLPASTRQDKQLTTSLQGWQKVKAFL